jgi:hypothetical protein
MELRIVYDSSTARGEDRAAHTLLGTPILVALAARQ